MNCRFLLLLAPTLLLTVTASARLRPQQFAKATQPRFEPEKYFLGHTRSWGVFEARSGANPTRRFRTECFGRRVGAELHLAQTFYYEDGTQQHREWRIRRLDAHRYEARASDVVGVGRGEAYGNAFHWEYTVALKPGNPLFNVRLKQWMYLQEDGITMVNRGTVGKFGLTIAQVTEQFRRVR